MNFLSYGARFAGPALAALLLTSCATGDDGLEVEPPSPSAAAAKLCRGLDRELPSDVFGEEAREARPASPFTAAWGDPAIVLRCGVDAPAKMRDPEADSTEVDGVNWLMERGKDGSFRFTTVLRRAYVEVLLPEERVGDGLAPLTDLADPVRKAIPEGLAE